MTEPATRSVWNYRCKLCLNEAVVYQDNDLCFYCDPSTVAGSLEIEQRRERIQRRLDSV